MNEEWKVIPEHPEYAASSLGNIRLIKPSKFSTGTPLRPWLSTNGYPQVKICGSGKTLTKSVHRLVGSAFHGPCPVGHEIAHLDGNRRNSVPSNLRYVTPKENQSHRIQHGTYKCGETHQTAKLTEMQARVSRRISRSCMTFLASEWGVNRYTLIAIHRGKSWRSLETGRGYGMRNGRSH
jgi:hypothetical protein